MVQTLLCVKGSKLGNNEYVLHGRHLNGCKANGNCVVYSVEHTFVLGLANMLMKNTNKRMYCSNILFIFFKFFFFYLKFGRKTIFQQ